MSNVICTAEAFTVTINKLRLSRKNQWYYWSGNIDGKTIVVKGFGTWLQVFKINKTDHSNCMGETLKQFKQCLYKAVTYDPE